MKVELVNEITTIYQENSDLSDFLNKVNELKNIGIDHSTILFFNEEQQLSKLELEQLLPIISKHRTANKSFVMVTTSLDFDSADHDDFVVVPTLQEAFELIEMEDIERDLGF